MNYIHFCESHHCVCSLPLSLYDDGRKLLYSSYADSLPFEPLAVHRLISSGKDLDFCVVGSTTMYGCVTIKENGCRLILGPAHNVPVTESIVRDYMHENAILVSFRDALAAFLQEIPMVSYHLFLQHLDFLHLCLNGEKSSLLEQFAWEPEEKIHGLAASHVEENVTAKEKQMLHNTYYYEQAFYDCIRAGSPTRLKTFLHSDGGRRLQEGNMADTPLRQAKNIFIGTITKIGMLAAIPGGLDVEETYQLIDLYVRQCEQLTTLEEIGSLHYVAAMDFCKRIGDRLAPEGLSKEICICISYIRSHTNEDISISDVAAHIGRSSSYVIKRFKEELDINVGAFIMRCKLEEAKSLLTYSDKSLAEISSYLCFSSQSYFQNVFKKKFGVTPLQYRRQGQ